jgi:hypothetical protein
MTDITNVRNSETVRQLVQSPKMVGTTAGCKKKKNIAINFVAEYLVLIEFPFFV